MALGATGLAVAAGGGFVLTKIGGGNNFSEGPETSTNQGASSGGSNAVSSGPSLSATPMPRLATPSPAQPTPVPPTPTPSRPVPGTVLYAANWASGMDGWSGSGSWQQLSGKIVCSGKESGSDGLFSPSISSLTRNYSVLAVFRLLKYEYGSSMFGIFVRSSDRNARYQFIHANVSNRVGIYFHSGATSFSGDPVADIPRQVMAPLTITLKAECFDNQFRMLINDSLVCNGMDNRLLEPGRIGVWARDTQVEVTEFQVTAL